MSLKDEIKEIVMEELALIDEEQRQLREQDLQAIISKITLETRFDSIGHSEPWKNNLANELNLLLHYARVSKPSFIPLALSLAARIAQFEEIRFV